MYSADSDLEFVDLREVQPSGLVIQNRGMLRNGEKHGLWHVYWDGQLQYIETWRDGVQDGVVLSYGVSKDRLLSDRYYVNGEQHGRSRAFHGDDNRLTALRWWQRGVQHGYWCEWSDDGRLLRIEKYHRGRFIESEEPPARPCPYTSTAEGQHHFDPDDRTYKYPYPRPRRRQRAIPLPTP